MSKKVIFFFPWKEISGGPYYLTGLANGLAEDETYDVYYVDYSPGLSDRLLHGNVNKIAYSEPFSLDCQNPITLIVPIYCAPFIPKIHPKSIICFLSWHNFSIQALVDAWRLTNRWLQKFLRLIYDQNGIFFLDQTHLIAQNEWIEPRNAYQFKEVFVPICGGTSSIRCDPNLIDPNEMNIAVLGRLSDDKVLGIINLIEQLELLETKQVINIHIIGEGDRKEWITSRKWKDNICLHFYGTIIGDELKYLLASTADVLFAMGMSLLEGAAIELPCVIMPHNVTPFHVNAFTYLQESKGYALGWYETQIDELGVPTHEVGEIMRDIYGKRMKAALGAKAREYKDRTHASNISLLIKAIEGSSLTYADFFDIARHQGKIRVLGLPVATINGSFDGKTKSISLFGIKNIFQYSSVTDDGKKELLVCGHSQNWILVRKREGKYYAYIRFPFLKF